MYQIAICDDKESELGQVEAFLEEYRNRNPEFQYRAETYQDAQMLLNRIREQKDVPDLLLMDIFMPGKTGIEAVQELRREGVDIPVIFLTTSTEYALKAFEVDALQYLVKPFDKEKFILVLDKAWKRAGKGKEELLMVKVSGGMRQIDPGLIIYCETQKNYQILYLREEQIKVRMTGGELYRILKNSSGFVRCGSSYIFNLNHIVAVDRDEIRTDAGNRILIPRNRAAEFKKMYFAFYFGRN